MPIYEEKVKHKETGEMIPKLVNGKKQYYIRTYVEDEFGNKKQIKRHNKKWVGNVGKNLAQQEEVRLKNNILKKEINGKITIRQLKEKYLNYCKPQIDNESLIAKESKLNHFCEIDHTHQVTTHPNLDVRKYTKDMFSIWKQQMKDKLYVNANIKDEYLQEWKKEEHERKYKWKTYSIKYLNKVYNEICAMLDYAINEGCCTYNFAKQSGKIGTAKEIKLSSKSKEYDIIDYEEYLRLMEATKDDLKYNTMFDMLFTRGPRVGEIRAFQVCNYDYINSRIKVEHTMAKGNVLKEPKTSSSKEWIYLSDNLNRKINNLINGLKKQDEFDNSWFIFGGKNPISEHAINYNKDKYFKIANIDKKISIHKLRHSCATWLHSIGIDIAVISKILRHSNIGVTLETYTHLFEDDYLKALEKINKY